MKIVNILSMNINLGEKVKVYIFLLQMLSFMTLIKNLIIFTNSKLWVINLNMAGIPNMQKRFPWLTLIRMLKKYILMNRLLF